MSPEWIYVTKTSNWAHELTSVDSSTWKKALELEMLLFHLSPGLSHLPTFWNVLLNSIAGRDINFMFALLSSPRRCFAVFNKQGFTIVFPIVCVFLLGNFKFDLIWCLSSWLKLPSRYVFDVSNSPHGVGRILNFFWHGWDALFLNSVSNSKVSYT